MYIEFILTEAARTLGQALRITFLLFWWLGLGVVNLYRRVTDHIEENQVKGSPFTANGRKAAGVACRACGAANEAGETRCFVCGTPI